MMMIWMLLFFVVMLVYVGVVSADDVGVVSDSKVLFRKEGLESKKVCEYQRSCHYRQFVCSCLFWCSPTFAEGSFLTLRLVVYYSMLGEMLTKIGQSNVYKQLTIRIHNEIMVIRDFLIFGSNKKS